MNLLWYHYIAGFVVAGCLAIMLVVSAMAIRHFWQNLATRHRRLQRFERLTAYTLRDGR